MNTLWFAPNNGGVAAGTLVDYDTMFAQTNLYWHRRIQKLLLLNNVTRNRGQNWINSILAPFIQKTGIEVSIVSATPTGRQCKTVGVQNASLANDIQLIGWLNSAGVTVHDLFMESTVSRFDGICATYTDPNMSLSLRLDDMIWYMQGVKNSLGSDTPSFGLVDATNAKGNQWVQNHLNVATVSAVFDYVLSRLAAETSPAVSLSTIQIDQGYENHIDFDSGGLTSVAWTNTLADYLISLGLRVVLELTSVDPASNHDFNEKIVTLANAYKASGTSISNFMHIAFRAYPTNELPEPVPYTETSNVLEVADIFNPMPAMFARRRGNVRDGLGRSRGSDYGWSVSRTAPQTRYTQ